MLDSGWRDFIKWLQLVAEMICDFIFLSVWGILALILHHLFEDIFLLRGWPRQMEYVLEVLINVSVLVRLFRLRFSSQTSRTKSPWWR